MIVLVVLLLLGLPALGVVLAGGDVRPYHAFPPLTAWVEHAPFSWFAFIAMSIAILAVLIHPVAHMMRAPSVPRDRSMARAFTWWGWVALVFGAMAWIIAWTRIPMFAAVQRHTYTPLWLAYIVAVNAIAYARSGRCMMLDDTRVFVALFPASAAFWWFFEYLNRYVQNWSYHGIEGFTAAEYVAFASVSFSTVLPAVLGTRDVLLTVPAFRTFDGLPPFRFGKPRAVAAVALAASAAGLLGVGVLPDALFPLVWVAPGLVVVCLQALAGRRTVFEPLARGELSGVIAACAAALVCGWFWEMWNAYSLAKWIYHVPFVQRFHVFEMPLLGFAGYLPFGLECLVVGEAVRSFLRRPGE